MGTVRSRAAKWAPFVVAGLIPTLIVAISNAQFILTHFYINAPYLLDSGFYSGLIYHAGISPHNPNIALDFAPLYFTFHLSPFVSAFSLLSEIQPLGRIEWYALFQAIVFAPIGIATYLVARHLEPEGLRRRFPLTMVVSLVFSFCGLVLTFVGYPHYEPAIPALGCLVLVFVVTGRLRLAWLFLVVAASVREDAGFHTGLLLMPLLYLRWRKVEVGASLKQLMIMIAAAGFISIGEVAIQKMFFASQTLNYIYLGDPPFHHVTWDLITTRASGFVDLCKHIYYPFLATVLVAILRRDARYVLGWASTVPWFLLNFLAAQDVKATFYAYTGIPFLVSIFWVYVYGALITRPERRLRAWAMELIFGLVAFSSTLGSCRTNEVATRIMYKDLFVPRDWHAARVDDFMRAIGEHKDQFKHVAVDYAVASHTLEYFLAKDSWYKGVTADAIGLHRGLYIDGSMSVELVHNQIDWCTRARETPYILCTQHAPPPDMFRGIDVQTIPSAFAFTELHRSNVTVRDNSIVLDEVRLQARLGVLPAGTYEMTISLKAPPTTPPGHLAELEPQTQLPGQDIVLLPVTKVETGATEIKARVTVDGKQFVTFRMISLVKGLALTNVTTRLVEPVTTTAPTAP